MRAANDAEFFQRPPPPGTSRESTLRLDSSGKFWHEGKPVENARMARAFSGWIDQHPDGRYILNNGYDWVYLSVDDAPFFVESVAATPDGAELTLSNGATQGLRAADIFEGAQAAVYVRVRNSSFIAKFSRTAQLMLEPWLCELGSGELGLELAGQACAFGTSPAHASVHPSVGTNA